MGTEVYIDWENIWLEHVQRCLPGLYVPRRGDAPDVAQKFRELRVPGRPDEFVKTTDATPEAIATLATLPSIIAKSLSNALGAPPQTIIAAAVWDKLFLANECNTKQALSENGIIAITPNTDGHKQSELKNASDFHLTLEMWRRHGARLRQKLAGDTTSVYIFSGDHIFSHLDHVCSDCPEFDLGIVAFQSNIAGALRKKGKSKLFKLGKHYLDHDPEYIEARRRALRHCLLHKQKMSRPPSYHDRIRMTAIKRLKDKREDNLTEREFRRWIRQWLEHWKQIGLNFKVSDQNAIDYLIQQRVVSKTTRRLMVDGRNQDVKTVSLEVERPNAIIQEAVRFLRANRYGFEHFYDVPPPYAVAKRDAVQGKI
ncbi:MAG: hypothetical protein CTY20_07920 [Hyphomicrobium sp.]|nr:MAG: hypothetical protein CTY20_07920 [Hyphomicrobium sp.]